VSTIAAWVERHSVGFGAVGFKVMSYGGWADWIGESIVVTRHVPGGTETVTQFMGSGPERVTYDLALGSAADFSDFKALMGTRATLTLEDATATTDGETAILAGDVYLEIPDVLLVTIEPDSIQRRTGGYVLCRAVFQR
jgi:hypothetical protein